MPRWVNLTLLEVLAARAHQEDTRMLAGSRESGPQDVLGVCRGEEERVPVCTGVRESEPYCVQRG